MGYGYGYGYDAVRRGGRPAVPGPTDIALSASAFDQAATVASTVAVASATSDTPGATYTFALSDDADGMFVFDGANLNLATAVPAEEAVFLRDVTIRATIVQTGGTSSETFTLTITPVDTSNDSGLDDTEGTLVPVGEFTIAPTVGGNGGALKFKGKSGGLAYFVFDIGAATANGVYTYSYIPYFSELSNQGRDAFVGFGFKTGDSFHLAGLKGDGATGLTKHTLSGTSTASITSTGSGAPTNGTQAGPNFIQIEIAADGLTYTFRTSADGATWADEFTDATPTPFSDTGTTQFGLAVFLENSDKGKFSLDVTEWSVAGVGPDYSQTKYSLALEFDGANGSTAITDLSSYAHTATVGGDAQINNNALLLDGTGDYVSFPDNAAFHLGSEDFVIEFDITPDSLATPGVSRFILGQFNTGTGQRSYGAFINTDGFLSFQTNTNGISGALNRNIVALSSLSTTVSTRIRIVRSGGTITTYANDELQDTYERSDALWNSDAPFTIGAQGNLSWFFAGKIDNVVLIKGAAS